ncbi:N-acetyltransferase family protein, putative [Cordyceps militaris CM01]|uniref:N-acetyltransferase family protein, putative n=1 Tax=Cordyceps militaris (strain CM01) TaxID=983644 RepID=G3J2I9_CORMM|nr:N-acetyltransferase family protein, putative [Cordyceps militaris CM01]EGX95525.1 N-acetyltransferase family protein, putative [Cordyceps militaris CM01]
MSLTEEQLDRALSHIEYPRSQHAADPLRRLQQLMLHHVARVPFENVGLHYNPTHRLSLALDDLFDKIVVRSKGGYCLELNALFAAILRGLGYTVLTVGGRAGASDFLLSRRLSSRTNTFPLSRGGSKVPHVPARHDRRRAPFPLISGTEFTVLAPRRGRLEYRSIDLHTDPTQRLWVYSTRDSLDDDAAPWVEQYCFVELEHFAADYHQMNYYTSTNPQSFFMPHLLAVRALVAPDPATPGDVRLAGMLTYWRDEVRRRSEGSMERRVVDTATTEAERIAALEKWFGIPLTEADRESIFSTGLALDRGPEQPIQ